MESDMAKRFKKGMCMNKAKDSMSKNGKKAAYRWMAAVLSIMVSAALLAGCGNARPKEESSAGSPQQETVSANESVSKAEQEALADGVYSMQVELSGGTG